MSWSIQEIKLAMNWLLMKQDMGTWGLILLLLFDYFVYFYIHLIFHTIKI